MPVRTVSQKFIRPWWGKIFKGLWGRPRKTADFGSSFWEIPYTSNICLLEDKIQKKLRFVLVHNSYGSCAMDQRSRDGWISGWSQILAFYQRNSWTKLWVTRCENCFSTEQNHSEYPLQERGQSGGNESSKRRPLPPRKTDRLPDLRSLSGHWSQWFCRELCGPIYSCVLRNDDIQEFDSKSDETLLSMTQIPSDDILESLYKLRIRGSEKLKTVLELEILQKKAGPDHHRLKTMERKYRAEFANEGFLRPETEIMKQAPWSIIRG